MRVQPSYMRAGLIPGLDTGALAVPGSQRWPREVMKPGQTPLQELAVRLANRLGGDSVEMAAATQFTVQAALQKWLSNSIKVESVVASSTEAVLTVTVSYSVLNTDVTQVQTFVYGGNP